MGIPLIKINTYKCPKLALTKEKHNIYWLKNWLKNVNPIYSKERDIFSFE